MQDILDMVSKLHLIRTKDQEIFNELKEIISESVNVIESRLSYEENHSESN